MGVGAHGLAFAAGVLTAFSPCVLPLLAVTVTTAFQRHRFGPLALAAGLAVSATVLGLIFAMAGLALDRDLVRLIAAGLLVVVGGVLLSAKLQSGFSRLAAPVASRATVLVSRSAPGGWQGQLVVGALLGVVWSPCAGPTLAAAIGLAAQRTSLVSATTVLAAFSLGAALPLVLIAYGSREVFGRRAADIARIARPLTATMLIVVGVLTLSGGDRVIETKLVDLMPGWLITLTSRF
ncbi:MAG: cytochrome C biogenesis protein [Candidatus Rokuibacteriota bacterium]|nr:MAG: cytochrome C biogenesis protein [Candidatus Rokubacteria bacterium]